MRSFGGLSEQVFELGEHLLDGVQVWGVGRQEDQRRTCLADGATYLGAFVAAQSVFEKPILIMRCA
jgi:hypothetical protein